MSHSRKTRICLVGLIRATLQTYHDINCMTGIMSAAIVGGVQSKGVASCIKHFVANDQESERYATDSVMSDRALREIYLYP